MNRVLRFFLFCLLGTALSSPALFGQELFPLWGGSRTTWVQSYYYPSHWGYGGYFSPFLELPSLPPPYPYMPNYWWVSPYPIGDPRQAGYNPSSGYRWEDVATLLLVTNPTKTRVILDGVFVGTTNYLGPIQLPVGEHSLRVEAAGYEPSETVLNIERPVLQQLEVQLTPMVRAAKPAPRQ